MSFTRTLVLIAVFAGLVVIGSTAAYAQGELGDGTVRVKVEMGTAGEALPEGLEVELLFLANGQGPPIIFREPVVNGVAEFADVATAPQHRYLARVSYGGYQFFSDLVNFGDELVITPTVTIYATTNDLSLLRFGPTSVLADVRREGWLVGVLYTLVNPTDRLITPAEGNGLFIPLPDEARDLTFEDQAIQENARTVPGGVRLETAFMPGGSRVLFSFTLPYEPPEQTLAIPVVPGVQVGLLVAELGQEAEAEGLEQADPVEAQDGRLYLAFRADEAPEEGVIRLNMRALPNAESLALPESDAPLGELDATQVPVGLNERLPWWTPLVGAALAAAAVALYIRRRQGPDLQDHYRRRREELIAFIAQLDERFEAGRIGERSYRQQREAAKQELKSLLQEWLATPQERGSGDGMRA